MSLHKLPTGARRRVNERNTMNRKLGAALVALALGIGSAIAVPMSASAHTAALSGVASCQADGTYYVAWTGTLSNYGDHQSIDIKVIKHAPAGSKINGVDGQVWLFEWPSHSANHGLTPFPAGGVFTYTQTGIPGDAKSATSGYQYDWEVGGGSGDPERTITLKGDCKATPPTITVPTLTPLAPTCDENGNLPLLNNPPAQNPGGYEVPGAGYRVYYSPAPTNPAAPGTYTATIQKIGAGFDPAFPNGTKVTGQTTQTLVVLAKLGQNADPTAPCFTGGDKPKDKVEVIVTTDAPNCETDTVATKTSTITTPYVWIDGAWVLGTPVQVDAYTYRDATTAECVPDSPEPYTTERTSERVDCEAKTVVISVYTTDVTWVWDLANLTWGKVEIERTTPTSVTERAATAEETGECPVVKPPTKPTPTASLAVTGADPAPFLWFAGIIAAAGAGLLLRRRTV